MVQLWQEPLLTRPVLLSTVFGRFRLGERDEDLLEGGLADRVVADHVRGKQRLGSLHRHEEVGPGDLGVAHVKVDVVLNNRYKIKA